MDVTTLVKAQSQCCCLVSGEALPPDQSVPFMFGKFFIMCIPTIGICKRVRELRSMRLP